MGFAENLKEIRKQRNITQEELAEILNVSRQAVSKWEAGNGYPETEKLLILAHELNISLDYLFSNTAITEDDKSVVCAPSGKIAIATFDDKNVVVCHSVKSSKILASAKGSPKYILEGIDSVSFWGENKTILGWYKTIEDIQKEISEITQAINKGEGTYKLKYNVDIEFVGVFGQPKIKDSKEKSVVCAPAGKIAIATYDNKNVAMCSSVKSQRVLFAKKDEPKYLLLGTNWTSDFLFESPPELGWYETLEDINKEIIEITEAIMKGEPSYKLKYNADIEVVGIFKRPKLKNKI